MARVKALLDGGAKVDARDRRGYMALMRAAAKGHIDVARLLLAKGADPNARKERARATKPPFPRDTGPGSPTLAVQITKAAEKAARDLEHLHWTPLVWAVARDDAAMARVLLDKGAKPNVSGLDDLSPSGHTTPLLRAVRNGSGPITRLLLARGARVDPPPPESPKAPGTVRTPLMVAAEKGDAEIVLVLLGKGADARKKDKNGDTAMSLAARCVFIKQ